MTEHFSLWQERCLADAQSQMQAQEMLRAFADQQEDFAHLCKVNQSGPYHDEGPYLRDHLLRALTFLFAVQQPACGLSNVDEWHSAKHVRFFFTRLQETLLREKDFLIAYLLAHDIGKKDTVTQDERGWHYHGHAQKGAEGCYAPFREACLVYAHCPLSDAKLLRELVRIHMDINWNISQNKETNILGVAREIGRRQGVNVERFLALLPAAFFLDVIGGSLEKRSSSFERARMLITYAECEYLEFPQKKEEDFFRMQREEREATKMQLRACGLGPDEWFMHLQTPFGKERGVVVKILEHFIAGVEDAEDIRYVGDEHARELRMRSMRYREQKEK